MIIPFLLDNILMIRFGGMGDFHILRIEVMKFLPQLIMEMLDRIPSGVRVGTDFLQGIASLCQHGRPGVTSSLPVQSAAHPLLIREPCGLSGLV